jgi:DNA polymerase-3 subunit delta
LAAEGVNASVVLGSALRHALMLLSSRIAVEDGRSVDTVMEGMRSLHFRRKPLVKRHLQLWTSASLKEAIAGIQASILESRKLAPMGDAIMAKTLLDVARAARR